MNDGTGLPTDAASKDDISIVCVSVEVHEVIPRLDTFFVEVWRILRRVRVTSSTVLNGVMDQPYGTIGSQNRYDDEKPNEIKRMAGGRGFEPR